MNTYSAPYGKGVTLMMDFEFEINVMMTDTLLPFQEDLFNFARSFSLSPLYTKMAEVATSTDRTLVLLFAKNNSQKSSGTQNFLKMSVVSVETYELTSWFEYGSAGATLTAFRSLLLSWEESDNTDDTLERINQQGLFKLPLRYFFAHVFFQFWSLKKSSFFKFDNVIWTDFGYDQSLDHFVDIWQVLGESFFLVKKLGLKNESEEVSVFVPVFQEKTFFPPSRTLRVNGEEEWIHEEVFPCSNPSALIKTMRMCFCEGRDFSFETEQGDFVVVPSPLIKDEVE